MTSTVEIKGAHKVESLKLDASVLSFQLASGEVEVKIHIKTLSPDVLMSALEHGLKQKLGDGMAAPAGTARADRIARVRQIGDNLSNDVWSMRAGDGIAATAIEPLVRRLFLSDIAKAQGVDVDDITALNKAIAALGKHDSFKGKKGFELVESFATQKGWDANKFRAMYVERANIEREAQAEAAKAVADLDLDSIEIDFDV